MVSFYDLTINDVEIILREYSLEKYRVLQLWNAIYKQGIYRSQDISTFPISLRNTLEQVLSLKRLKILDVVTSQDRSSKFLIELSDGNSIESVLIPECGYYTLCVSSQVGCAMNCKFCCTGYNGYRRNLSIGEIVGQYLIAKDFMNDWPVSNTKPKIVRNIVFMGMGEPLHNYDNVCKAITILTDQQGLNLSTHHITVSTCGIPDKILSLAKDLTINLAISLHATNDELRSELMPINNRFPLKDLLKTCRDYYKITGRSITFEYILIRDVNDNISDAQILGKLLVGIKAKINLIQFNEWDNTTFKSSSVERTNAFANILRKKGYRTFIRFSGGSDINAACGQLSGKIQNNLNLKQ